MVKLFLNAGVQIRHINNLTPMNFVVDSSNFYAARDTMEGGKLMEHLLILNETAYINHYNSVFEVGVDLADIEVIPSSARAQDLYLNIVKSAKEEILWIFPTTNAIIRQDKMGAISLAV